VAVRDVEDLKVRMRLLMNKWHVGGRQGNDGNPGNTLEDLLEIDENNHKLPDFGEIEIKTQKFEGPSPLLTLFHKEPKPAASIPKLLKCIGWKHSEAGELYPASEMSFRSTTYGHRYSDRGLKIEIVHSKIEFRYDPSKVNRHCLDRTGIYKNYGCWADDVETRSPHYKTILPVHYDLSEIEQAFKTKLSHTLLARYKNRTVGGKREYLYEEAYLMKDVKPDMIPVLIKEGHLVIDFDARTGHNHGTKFRVKKEQAHRLFTEFALME